LRDRIDLWVTMPRMSATAIVATREPEGSAVVGERIAAARARAVLDRGGLNGRLRGRALRRACRLSASAAAQVVVLAEAELASGRGTERLLRVARTIADLDGSMTVEPRHLDEAAWYRSPATRAAEALAS
jgi:magnesium chelatase family protein